MSSPVLTFPWLQHLAVARLRFVFEAQAPLDIGPFPENRVRSSLGLALRRLQPCADDSSLDCPRCPHSAQCPWFSMFDVSSGEDGSPVRPYTLQLTLPERQMDEGGWSQIEQGARVQLDLTLFGPLAEAPIPLVMALANPETGSRLFEGPVRLLDTTRILPDGSVEPYHLLMSIASPWADWLKPAPMRGLTSAMRARVHVRTPLMAIVKKEKVTRGAEFTVALLVRLAVRRTQLLAKQLGGYQPANGQKEDLSAIYEAASGVEVSARQLQWESRIRHGARQKQTVHMGGLVGWLDLEGNLEPLLPLLLAAELAHLGKAAAFGFGEVGVEISPLLPRSSNSSAGESTPDLGN